MAKESKEKTVTIRFKDQQLRLDYLALSKISPFSFNGLVQLAMEIALPHLRKRIDELRKPIE